MLEIREISKPGTRKVNEDFTAKEKVNNVWCLALADGLGGLGKGNVASSTAVEAALEYFREKGMLSRECLAGCFEEAQAAVMQKQQEMDETYGMKTTLALLLTDGERAVWGHIGDSRIYRIEEGERISHTADHSVPQMLAALGEIREEDIRGHADRNRLLKAIGLEWSSPEYTISQEVMLGDEESFLLCSDGFWEGVLEEEMLSGLREAKDTQEWLENMEGCLLRWGGQKEMDNYSAIAVINER